MTKLDKDEIHKALLKKAKGFKSCDEQNEYVVDENENLKLTKKKITKKFISPDIQALKVLLEFYANESADEFSELSDDELEKERKRLLEILAKEVKDIGTSQEKDEE